MRRLAHSVTLRERMTDEDGLIFFEGTVTVPKDLPFVERSDMGGDWFLEHEIALENPVTNGGRWVQIVKSPMPMTTTLDVLCGLAQSNLIVVEDNELLALPSDFYTILGQGYDDEYKCFSRRYNEDTHYRMRNANTGEIIAGDML